MNVVALIAVCLFVGGALGYVVGMLNELARQRRSLPRGAMIYMPFCRECGSEDVRELSPEARLGLRAGDLFCDRCKKRTGVDFEAVRT